MTEATAVPNWLLDFLGKRRARPAALQGVLALLRHGSVWPGEHRVYRSWSRELWAELSFCSKRALDLAIDELTSWGLLRVHPALRSDAPDGFSLPLLAPSRGSFSAVSEQVGAEVAGVQDLHPLQVQVGADPAPHDVDDVDPDLSLIPIVSDLSLHPSPDQKSNIITRARAGARGDVWDHLAALQVLDPDRWLAEFEFETFEPALTWLWKQLPDSCAGHHVGECWWDCRVASSKFTNPAGMLRIKLESLARAAGVARG